MGKKAASKQGKIYVGKFNQPITEDEIKSFFGQYGNVVEIQRPVDRSKNSEPKNFCFITFDKEDAANIHTSHKNQALSYLTKPRCYEKIETYSNYLNQFIYL